MPSKAWLKAKLALFIVSKQSLTSVGLFFFKINSPSDPAFALNAVKKITVNKKGKVRRSKIFYLRELTGKKARIKEARD